MKPWMRMPELPEPPYYDAAPRLSDFLDDDIGTKSDWPQPGTVAATNLELFLGVLKDMKAPYKKETYCMDIDASPNFVTVKHEIAPALLYSRPKGHLRGLILFTISMLLYLCAHVDVYMLVHMDTYGYLYMCIYTYTFCINTHLSKCADIYVCACNVYEDKYIQIYTFCFCHNQVEIAFEDLFLFSGMLGWHASG